MVEPTLLRIQSFVAGTGLTAVASAGFYAYLLTHVLFLNYVWGYTLLEAGMAVAPPRWSPPSSRRCLAASPTGTVTASSSASAR